MNIDKPDYTLSPEEAWKVLRGYYKEARKHMDALNEICHRSRGYFCVGIYGKSPLRDDVLIARSFHERCNKTAMDNRMDGLKKVFIEDWWPNAVKMHNEFVEERRLREERINREREKIKTREELIRRLNLSDEELELLKQT